MSERSAIEWTDSTFNPWIGCTKVGPGCDHCYAEALMETRHKRVTWGAGQPRVRTSTDNWKAPLSWNARPFYECLKCGTRFATNKRKEGYVSCPNCTGNAHGFAYDRDGATPVKQVRRRVFCASLADVFDNEVPIEWRADLFRLIAATPNLDWLLLTKRIGNVERMMAPGPWPANIWLGATVVNQEEADRDIPKLLAVPARVRFLSCEPLLGPLDLVEPLNGYPIQVGSGGPDSEPEWQQTAPPLSWVIVGGESGSQARQLHIEWVESIVEQCHAARVPCMVKQLGHRPLWTATHASGHDNRVFPLRESVTAPIALTDPKGGAMHEWPERLRVRQFPGLAS